MKNKQRGVLLLCTLAIMVILSILLMVGVYRMQSSTMATKKAIWEIKSYWAARAGNTVVADGCISNVTWPSNGLISQAGNYIISNNGNCIKGVDDISNSNFSIYYKNRLNKYYSADSSSPDETLLNDYFTNMNVKTGDFYALTAGKSGPSVVGLEFVYGRVDNSNAFVSNSSDVNPTNMQKETSISSAAAIYSEGSMNINVTNKVHITDKTGTRPYIISKGNISIVGSGEVGKYGSGPLDIGEGAVFAKKLSLSSTTQQKTTDILPTNTNTNLVNYSVNVYDPDNVANIDYNKIQSLSTKDSLDIPSGTFCFIEMPKKYNEKEFTTTVDSLMNSFLSPEQFYDVYFNSISESTITSLISWLTGNGSGNNEITTHFNSLLDNYDGDTYFSEKFSTFFTNGFKNLEGDKGIIGNLVLHANKDKFEQKYKIYLLQRIYNSITEYINKKEGGVANYEPMFIPEKYAGINNVIEFDDPFWDKVVGDSTVVTDNLNLNFETFTNARVYAELCNELNRKNEEAENSSDDFWGVLEGTIFGESTTAKKQKEVNYIKGNLRDIVFADIVTIDDIYIAKKIKTDNGNFIALHKAKDYNVEQDKFSDYDYFEKKSEFFDKVKFENSDESLVFDINSNLNSDGFFNFATFERYENINRYKQASVERSGIKLGGLSKSSISANGSISIKGTVEGKGYLIANNGGNISFEVGSNIDSGGENEMALIAKDGYIKMGKVSARSSDAANVNTDSYFKGVFSCNQLRIYAKECSTFTLEGIIICKGLIDVPAQYNIKNFDIIYNPDVSAIVLSYLDGWDKGISDYEIYLKSVSEGTATSTIPSGYFKMFNRI